MELGLQFVGTFILAYAFLCAYSAGAGDVYRAIADRKCAALLALFWPITIIAALIFMILTYPIILYLKGKGGKYG